MKSFFSDAGKILLYVAAILGVFGVMLGLVVLTVLLHGWVLSTLWGWFVVPIFALPALGLWQAVGLSLFVSYFRGIKVDDEEEPEPKRKDDESNSDFLRRRLEYQARKDAKAKREKKRLIKAVLYPFLILLIGYAVKSWAF